MVLQILSCVGKEEEQNTVCPQQPLHSGGYSLVGGTKEFAGQSLVSHLTSQTSQLFQTVGHVKALRLQHQGAYTWRNTKGSA